MQGIGSRSSGARGSKKNDRLDWFNWFDWFREKRLFRLALLIKTLNKFNQSCLTPDTRNFDITPSPPSPTSAFAHRLRCSPDTPFFLAGIDVPDALIFVSFGKDDLLCCSLQFEFSRDSTSLLGIPWIAAFQRWKCLNLKFLLLNQPHKSSYIGVSAKIVHTLTFIQKNL